MQIECISARMTYERQDACRYCCSRQLHSTDCADLLLFWIPSGKKTTHFVSKNEKSITVSLEKVHTDRHGKSAEKKKNKKPKAAPKALKTKKEPKKSVEPKKVKKSKTSPKKSKKQVVKPAKKPKVRSLFSKVKIGEKKVPQNTSGSRKKNRDKKDKGAENRYFAHVEQMLRGWPAQANFAGEEIFVRLKIFSDGRFEFKVLKLSNNQEFNSELVAYLKQLQGIGFGPHRNGRPYTIEVQFVAHE